MFKLEFDAANKPLAAAIGTALVAYGRGGTTSATDAEIMEEYNTAPPFTGDLPEITPEREPSYIAAESVKLNDSAAGHSESQSAEPEEDETHVQETVEQGAGGAGGAAGVRVDNHGVPFDSDYCANAAKPFYASGKTAGQWKKGTKVEQALYDDWYALRLREVPTKAAEPVGDAPIDTTAAFSGQPVNNTGAPANAGAFMVWVSEMTTAGHFTQADVTAAYGVVGIGAADIFQGENAVQNIASLHGVLSAKVPA